MARDRQGQLEAGSGRGNAPLAASVGSILLDLRDALQKAERCRLALRRLGYSQKRWQEIVRDVNQELRFILRPQLLDAIVLHLESVGEPVGRKTLALRLHAQAAGSLVRIRQAITTNLRSGNLVLIDGDKVSLPAWRDRN
jgi:hypothetical protein